LDPILGKLGASAYSTTPIEYATGPGSAGEGQAEQPSMFDTLQMNVHLTVPDDLVVKGSDLRTSPDAPIGLGAVNVTLGGDLLVEKQPSDVVRLYGAVKTIRGTYDFQGRRFEILRDGTVQFMGLDELDPSLDIRARRVIKGVEANANIRGTLSRPRIVLTSTPPLEEADILALIVFNQPINQLGEGQQASLAARAQGMALGAAAGQLTQSIGSALNLETFELNMAPESGGSPGPTVRRDGGQNI